MDAWDPKVAFTVQHLRASLFTWYASETRAGRVRTQVQQLVPGMFGTAQNPAFDLHASETNHVLPWVKLVIEQYAPSVPNSDIWMQGIDSLLAMLDLYHRHGYSNWPLADIQTFCRQVTVHLDVLKALGIRGRPKHHFAMETGRRLSITGSLALSATWTDEGLNKVIKGIGKYAHRQVWSFRVLDEFARQTVAHSRVAGARTRKKTRTE